MGRGRGSELFFVNWSFGYIWGARYPHGIGVDYDEALEWI